MDHHPERMMPMKAAASPDGDTIIMVRGPWRQKVPAADLAKWITLYRGLRDREGGRFARFYAQPIEVLEALATRLGIKLPPIASAKGKK